MKTFARSTAGLIVILQMAGCIESETLFVQQVETAFSGNYESLPTDVKLVSWSEKGCMGEGVEASTLGASAISFERKVEKGTLAVSVQSDKLCANFGSGFVEIWDSGQYGPAPVQLRIECAAVGEGFQCQASGDGILFSGGNG